MEIPWLKAIEDLLTKGLVANCWFTHLFDGVFTKIDDDGVMHTTDDSYICNSIIIRDNTTNKIELWSSYGKCGGYYMIKNIHAVSVSHVRMSAKNWDTVTKFFTGSDELVQVSTYEETYKK